MRVAVITIGNSDVQIRIPQGSSFQIQRLEDCHILIAKKIPEIKLRLVKNRFYQDYYLLKNAREDGEKILQYWDEYRPVLQFPIVERFFSYLDEQNLSLSAIWWVFTNQEDSQYKQADTLVFRRILGRYAENRWNGIVQNDYEINERLIDIDYQYMKFSEKARRLIEQRDQIEEILLLPQGGIDQINQSLTLQLLRHFRHRTRLFQVAEGQKAQELSFPHLFLNDLVVENICAYARNYDFDKILQFKDFISIKKNSNYVNLCISAHYRLILNHENISADIDSEFAQYYERLSDFEKRWQKIKDLTYSIKISLHQERFNEAFVKLYSLYEVLFKTIVEEKYLDDFGEYCDIGAFYNRSLVNVNEHNSNWVQWLRKSFGNEFLDELVKKGTHLNNPNAMTCFFIVRYCVKNGLGSYRKYDYSNVKLFNVLLNDFQSHRNRVVHNLGTISRDTYYEILNKREITQEGFYELLDYFTGTNGMGDFEEIKERIIREVWEN